MASSLRDLTAKLYHSPVSRNAGWLYVLQASRYLFPLITVPYLVRVLGPGNYGVVAFGQGLIAYLTTLVNYGFDFSTTRKIAAVQSDAASVAEIASVVWTIKAMLCGVAFVILWALARHVPRLHTVTTLLLLLSGLIVGNTLFPTWLYLGLEQMAAITKISVAVRFIGVIAIFALVRQRADFLIYGAIIGLQSVAYGAAGFGYAFLRVNLRPRRVSMTKIVAELRDGMALFLSTGAITVYYATNAFILGLLADNAAVGYFSAPDKLVRLLTSGFDPISQAVFPRFNKLAASSKEKSMLWAGKLLTLAFGGGMVIWAGLYFGAAPIVRIFLGPSYLPSIGVLRTLAALPLLLMVSNVLGVQVMIPFRRDKIILYFVAGASVLDVVIAILLVPSQGARGMSLAILFSELFVVAGYFIYVSASGLNPLMALRRGSPAATRD